MNTRLFISSILAILIYFVCIFFMLKSKKLELKYSLLWILSGLCMLLVILFFEPFMQIMNLFGIIEPVNGIFAIMIFLLILLLISMTAVLSKLNNKLRTLTQKCAMYEKRIRDLEDKNE